MWSKRNTLQNISSKFKIKEDNYAFEQKFLNKFFNLEKNLKFIKIKTIYNKKD